MSSTIKLLKFCDHCGKAFIAQKTTTRYCGHKCNSAEFKDAGIIHYDGHDNYTNPNAQNPQ